MKVRKAEEVRDGLFQLVDPADGLDPAGVKVPNKRPQPAVYKMDEKGDQHLKDQDNGQEKEGEFLYRRQPLDPNGIL